MTDRGLSIFDDADDAGAAAKKPTRRAETVSADDEPTQVLPAVSGAPKHAAPAAAASPAAAPAVAEQTQPVASRPAPARPAARLEHAAGCADVAA